MKRTCVRWLQTGMLAVFAGALARPAQAQAQAQGQGAPDRAAAVRAPITDPAAQAYRRLLFELNLNPVPWTLVSSEAMALTTQTLPGSGEPPLIDRVKPLFEVVRSRMKKGVAAASATRRETAAKIFVLATHAVGAQILADLRAAEEAASTASGGLPRADLALVTSAHALWMAFADEVTTTDARGASAIDDAWRTMLDPAGHPSTRKAACSTLIQYVSASYLNPSTAPGVRLAPVPRGSPSFNAMAPIPRGLPPGSVIAKQVPRPRQVLHMVVHGADAHETPLIALGDMAFDSPFIFGEPARSAGISCNTCHNRGTTNPNFFIPGLSERPGGLDVTNAFFAPHANDGHFDHLDTPDLRGIRFTAPYGRDGRIASLREFVRTVIVHGFNGPDPDPLMLDGLVAYLDEFDFLPNPKIDSSGMLTGKATPAAHRGEAIFHKPMSGFGGGSCATCHNPSDFFLDRKRHDIASAGETGPNTLDRSFDTPTLLSCRFTAPYFHDGSLPTLRAVNEWFNVRFKLGLSRGDLDDLTAYVEAVGDGVAPFEDSPNFLAAEMEEFDDFLSTYEYLKDQAHWDLIDLTLRTVAGEIRLHSPMLQDKTQSPVLETLARLLDRAREALKRGEVERVDASIAEYRSLFAKKADVLR